MRQQLLEEADELQLKLERLQQAPTSVDETYSDDHDDDGATLSFD